MHQRTSWQIQKAVISALYLREMKTRFGSKKLGYLWAVLEPGAIIIAIWTMFGLHLRGGGSDDYPMFLMTGMLAFHMFSKITMSTLNAFQSNEGLFYYKQVKPIDTVITRTLVETLVYSTVFVMFMLIGGELGFQGYVHDVFALLLVFSGLVLFSFFYGLIGAVLTVFSETFPKVMGLMNRPLFFTSGIFFSLQDLPQQYHQPLLYNPLLGFLELVRCAYFANYESPDVSVLYLVMWVVSLGLLGMWLYVRLERRLIAS